MPSSLTTSRLKPPPHARSTFAACWHPETDVVLVNEAFLSPEESIFWCRECGSLYRGKDAGWEAPQVPPAVSVATHQHAPPLAPDVAALIAANQGIFLDVGCSDHKSAGSIGMDIRAVEGVDIVHDLEVFPWPLPDGCCKRILASHIIEHLDPGKMVDILNEMYRVMQVNGQLLTAMPYAGSPRFWQDPTHKHAWNEATACYFTPGHPLYEVYRPKPWKLELNEWSSVGDLNIIFSKLEESIQI